MAVPKRKHSNGRTGKRRSHDAISVRSASVCPQCGATVLPHRVCRSCGHYRGRQVMMVKVKESKKEK